MVFADHRMHRSNQGPSFMKDRRWLGLVASLAGVSGVALGKAGVVGANPPTFFALGVLATISIGGIVYGLARAWVDSGAQPKSVD